jgi:hypothetical protein
MPLSTPSLPSHDPDPDGGCTLSTQGFPGSSSPARFLVLGLSFPPLPGTTGPTALLASSSLRPASTRARHCQFPHPTPRCTPFVPTLLRPSPSPCLPRPQRPRPWPGVPSYLPSDGRPGRLSGSTLNSGDHPPLLLSLESHVDRTLRVWIEGPPSQLPPDHAPAVSPSYWHMGRSGTEPQVRFR